MTYFQTCKTLDELKKAYYAAAGHKWHRGTASMGEIRRKYGSQVFNAGREESGFDRISAAG